MRRCLVSFIWQQAVAGQVNLPSNMNWINYQEILCTVNLCKQCMYVCVSVSPLANEWPKQKACRRLLSTSSFLVMSCVYVSHCCVADCVGAFHLTEKVASLETTFGLQRRAARCSLCVGSHDEVCSLVLLCQSISEKVTALRRPLSHVLSVIFAMSRLPRTVYW